MTPGRGRFVAPATGWPRPWMWVQCQVCGATWVGVDDEECRWCRERIERWEREQT